MEEFFPETYRLDIRDERETFFGLFDGERQLDTACWGAAGEAGSGPDQGWGVISRTRARVVPVGA